MGNKILVSVFDSERAAFEGLSALKDLHRDGDITIYASTVIAKDASGEVSIRQSADRGPIGTLAGVVTGGLVGIFGGPAGIAVGAYIGGFGGLMYDLFTAGISLDFVDEVSAAMTPGKAAVIADVDEIWVMPVDTRLGALGGATFRRYPGEVVDAQLVRETNAARAELEQLRAELHEASMEAKSDVRSAIDAQRAKLDALVGRIDATLAKETAQFDAKLATLRQQHDQARADQRERIQARTAELKASHAARTAKLQEARRLAAESLEATREALVP